MSDVPRKPKTPVYNWDHRLAGGNPFHWIVTMAPIVREAQREALGAHRAERCMRALRENKPIER